MKFKYNTNLLTDDESFLEGDFLDGDALDETDERDTFLDKN